jgi:hypothetical protein
MELLVPSNASRLGWVMLLLPRILLLTATTPAYMNIFLRWLLLSLPPTSLRPLLLLPPISLRPVITPAYIAATTATPADIAATTAITPTYIAALPSATTPAHIAALPAATSLT